MKKIEYVIGAGRNWALNETKRSNITPFLWTCTHSSWPCTHNEQHSHHEQHSDHEQSPLPEFYSWVPEGRGPV